MQVFRGRAIYAIISFLVVVSAGTLYSGNNDIEAKGTGIGVNKDEALMAAKRNAIEKGIGTQLISQTEVENFQLKRDLIITKTLGAIKDYKIVSESKTPEGGIKITIQALISKSIMRKDLASFKILLESMNKPRVMVLINENNIGNQEPTNKAAENAVIGILKDPYEFDIIDESVAASIRKSKEKMAKVAENPAEAASIGSRYGAEVIITGNAVAREAKGMSRDLGGMKSVQADVTLKAINCSTGRIIGTSDEHAAKVHISSNTAGTKAIKAGSQKASKELIDSIIKDWNDQVNNGIPLALTVKNILNFRRKTNVLRSLEGIPGVVSVNERGWDSESRILRIDVTYKGNSNGFCMKTNGFKLKRNGSLAVAGQKGNDITLVVQAN